MYIIVVGGGKVGYYLTKTLLVEGHEVLLIERDRHKVEVYGERLGSVVLAGDGAEAAVLSEAGAQRADVVIAVTGEDEDNLVVCQMSKAKFHVPRAIARVNNPKNEVLFQRLGIDVTVSQTEHILKLIEQKIPEKSFVHLLNLRHDELAIVEAHVSEGSPVAHKRVANVQFPVHCVIAAIIRGPDPVIALPNTEILPGDELIIVTHSNEEEDLRQMLMES
ncbi:MAG: TrkA family potassium uptake protein [Chloroflexia bacterium]|jgi:trk system potassium uptake protein TrkA|nr:TrkA family potassium uptake protein [Chloroflexia bacterium]